MVLIWKGNVRVFSNQRMINISIKSIHEIWILIIYHSQLQFIHLHGSFIIGFKNHVSDISNTCITHFSYMGKFLYSPNKTFNPK